MKSWIVSTENVCILMQAVFAGPVQAAKKLSYTGCPANM